MFSAFLVGANFSYEGKKSEVAHICKGQQVVLAKYLGQRILCGETSGIQGETPTEMLLA